MNRRLDALALLTLVPLGLAGCNARPPPRRSLASRPPRRRPPLRPPCPPPDAGTTAPDGQSVAEACGLVTAAITSAGSELASFDMSSAASDPDAAVHAYLKMADALSKATAKVTNAQVPLRRRIGEASFTALTDALSKAFTEKETAATADFPALQAAASASMATFTNVCRGS